MNPETATKTNSSISLDLTDPHYAALCKYAGRVGRLLAMPTAITTTGLAGSLDDFLGAIYALIHAKQRNFRDRLDRPITVKPVAQLADRIATGTVNMGGAWM